MTGPLLLGSSANTGRDANAEAMRHKQHGVWLSWSRAAVSRHAERLAEGLRTRNVGAGSTVVVSGEYTPNLVLFVVAASHLGATVTPLQVGIRVPELAARLSDNAPDLVFLGGRDALGIWRLALDQTGRASDVVVDFHLPWNRPAGAGFTLAAELLGGFEAEAVPARSDQEVLWVEEGTEWPEGLRYILRAAAEGRSLAFPECRAAAHRDRADIQPSSFAVSPDRHARLVADLTSRLPTGASLAARLTRWGLEAGRAGQERWYHRPLLNLLRRSFGLARLDDLIVVGPRQGASPGYSDDLLQSLGIKVGHDAMAQVDAGRLGSAEIAFA